MCGVSTKIIQQQMTKKNIEQYPAVSLTDAKVWVKSINLVQNLENALFNVILQFQANQ